MPKSLQKNAKKVIDKGLFIFSLKIYLWDSKKESVMDTDYFFLCPTCKKMTIATGSGDWTDLVTCHECGESFKAHRIAGVGRDIVIKGRTISGIIDCVYQVCE